MRQTTVISLLFSLALLIASCNTPKAGDSEEGQNSRMELMVTKIHNEKDGQSIFMQDDKGGQYTTIISIPNGNWIDLTIGDRISLVATEILESHPAQIISKDIKVIEHKQLVTTSISLDKTSYKPSEAILLTLTVSNSTSVAYTFLPWGTPIENRFTGDCLTVTLNGKELPYTGIMVKRMAPTDKDYITLQQGENTSGQVNLMDGYKLTEKGLYKVQFKEQYNGIPASNVVELRVE